MKELIAGANLPLSAHDAVLKLHYHVTQGELDISAYLLAEKTGKVRGDADMLFFGQRYAENGAITLDIGENRSTLRIDTTHIAPEIKKIAVCATIDGAENLSVLDKLQFTLKSGGEEIASAHEEQKSRHEAALILAEIYRHNGIWKCRWVMQGFHGGLRVLAEYFGIEVAEEEEASNGIPQAEGKENLESEISPAEKDNFAEQSSVGETSEHSQPPQAEGKENLESEISPAEKDNFTEQSSVEETSEHSQPPQAEGKENLESETSPAEKDNFAEQSSVEETSEHSQPPQAEGKENLESEISPAEKDNFTEQNQAGQIHQPQSNHLPKIVLSREESNFRIYRGEQDFKRIRINLNWALDPNRKSGFLSNLLGMGTIDLDLGAMVRLKDGSSHVVQALGNQCGSRYSPPFIELQGDDRTGEKQDGEWLFLSGEHWSEIDLVVIFCFVYRGKEWPITTLSIDIPQHGQIEVPLSEYDQTLGLCGVVELRNQSHDINIQRIMKYFFDHKKLDQHYGFGIEWTKKNK